MGTVYSARPQLRLNKYLIFLKKVLSKLLMDVLTPVWCHMWFHQDRVLSHYGRCMWPYRSNISKQVDWVWWPPRSPDLSPVDFFLCVPWRALCMTRPSILKLTCWHKYQSLLLWPVFLNLSANPCRVVCVCIHTNGCNFEHFLWCFYYLFILYN